MRRLMCPICPDAPATPVLGEFEIQASSVRQSSQFVGALEAFGCQNGHIFFVRHSDVERDLDPRTAR